MSIPSIPLPHFSGKNELSLLDLDALSNAVRAQGLTSELVPAAAHHGRRQYTGADFNLSQFADACAGEVATPDKTGLIASVAYATADAPYIDAGNMILPLAHDYSPSDSSLPDESATGGVTSINVVDALQRPQINRGDIQLPLAQSDWGDDADGAMYTPGLIYAVQYDDADACEGSVLPRIEQGVIHLRTRGAGEVNLAHWDECTGISTAGVVHPVIEAEDGSVIGHVVQGVPEVQYMTQSEDARDVSVGVLKKVRLDTMGIMHEGTWQPSGVSLTSGVLVLPYVPFGVYSTALGRTVSWAELKQTLKETQVATWEQPLAGAASGDVGSPNAVAFELVVGVEDNMLRFKIQEVQTS